MKRFLFAISMVLVFGLPSAMAQKAKETGVVAHWSGTYRQDVPNVVFALSCVDPDTFEGAGGGCEGDLVECSSSEGIAVTKSVFYFLENICDDSMVNHPTPCDGRFTALAEECSDPAVDFHQNGIILDVSSRGITRICFDSTGTGDCTGTPAFSGEIGRGNTLTQTRLDVSGIFGGPASATTETTELTAVEFFDPVDREDKKLRLKETVAHVTASPNPSPDDDCVSINPGGVPGCGVAGTSVRSGTNR